MPSVRTPLPSIIEEPSLSWSQASLMSAASVDSFTTERSSVEIATASPMEIRRPHATPLPPASTPTLVPVAPASPWENPVPTLTALDVGLAERAYGSAEPRGRARLLLAGASAVALALIVGLSAGLSSAHKSSHAAAVSTSSHVHGTTTSPMTSTSSGIASTSSTLPPTSSSPTSTTGTSTTATSIPSHSPLALGTYRLSGGQSAALSTCTSDAYACNPIDKSALYTVSLNDGHYVVNGVPAAQVSLDGETGLTFPLVPRTFANGVNGCAFYYQAQATLIETYSGETHSGFNGTVVYTYTAAPNAVGCVPSFAATPCKCVYGLSGSLEN